MKCSQTPAPPVVRGLPAALAACLAPLVIAGCQTSHYFDDAPALRGPTEQASAPARDVARILPIYSGRDGTALGWEDLMDAVAWADVVIIGETHDDAVGHAVQLAVVEDAVRRWPRTALSMEMLERDEQPIVDDYFDGIIDAEALAKLTLSENWGAEGMWFEWYQPIIDAAKDGGGRVIAANAPRRYVRLARTDGYERLAGVPRARRQWFDYPANLPEGPYRDRFFSLMAQAHAAPSGDEPAATDDMPSDDVPEHDVPAHDVPEHDVAEHDIPARDVPARDVPAHAAPTEDETAEHVPAMPAPAMPAHLMGDAMVESMFRSQLVWDATMAASIARARFRGASKVIHLVGGFHAEFEGGTVLELRKRMPGARILVISMEPAWPDTLRDEDLHRGDVVVYTGVIERDEDDGMDVPVDEDAGADEGDGDGEDADADAN